MKYIITAFIAIGALLAVSAAQAAPLSPSAVQTEQAVASGSRAIARSFSFKGASSPAMLPFPHAAHEERLAMTTAKASVSMKQTRPSTPSRCSSKKVRLSKPASHHLNASIFCLLSSLTRP